MKTLAKEIMSTEILSVVEGMSVEAALKILVNNKVTGLPVVDHDGKMIGVLSEYDILSLIAEKRKEKSDLFRSPIKFSTKVEAISEDTSLSKVLNLFVKTKYRRLPVVNETGKLVGIITRRDLMRIYYYRSKVQ